MLLLLLCFVLLAPSVLAQTMSWVVPPPASVLATKQVLSGLTVSVSNASYEGEFLITSTADFRVFFRAPCVKGRATFPDFVIGNDLLVFAGNQQLTVTAETSTDLMLTTPLYIIPTIIDIGSLIFFGGGPGWTDFLLPALLAVDLLNTDNQVLPNTTLRNTYLPSNCSQLIASKSLFTLLQNPNVVAIVGPECSGPATVITPMASAFGVPLISGSAGNPVLSNKKAYPLFMRTIANGNSESSIMISFLKEFKWKQVAIITFNVFPIGDFLYSSLFDLGITVAVNIVIQSGKPDFLSELRQIQESSATIIVTNVYDNDSPDMQILTKSAKSLGMLTAPYVWVLGGSSGSHFIQSPYLTNEDKSGHLCFTEEAVMHKESHRKQVCDLYNNDTYLRERGYADHGFLDRSVPMNPSNLSGLNFIDAVYTIAHGINSMILNRQDIRGDELYAAMRKQEFEGVAGHVQFDENGDMYPLPNFATVYQHGSWVKIGKITPIVGSSNQNFTLFRNVSFTWPGGIPGDQVPLAFKSVAQCPVGYGRYLVGEVYNCIRCPQGTYNWVEGNTQICPRCPEDLECPGGEAVEVSKGKWLRNKYETNSTIPEVYHCPHPEACCPTGFCGFEGCAKGFTGPLCTDCIKENYYMFHGECKNCSRGVGTSFYIIIVMSFICTIGLLCLPFDEAPTVEILFFYFQVTLYIFEPQVNGILSNPGLSTFLAATALHVDLLVTDCPLPLGGMGKLLLRYFMPVLMLFDIVIIYFLLSFIETRLHKNGANIHMFMPYYMKNQSIKLICFRAILIVLTFVVMPLIDASLLLLQCMPFEGQSVLRGAPQIVCFSLEHSGPAAVAIIVLVLMMILFPLGITLLLVKIKRANWVTYEHGDVSQIQSLFQCLYHAYKPEFYYMMPITIIEKGLTSTMFALLAPTNVTLQLDVYIVVLIFTCATRIYWQPYNNTLEAYLNREVSLGILAMIAFRQYTDHFGVSDLLMAEIGIVIFLPLVLHMMRWTQKNYFKHKEVIQDIISKKTGSQFSGKQSKKTQGSGSHAASSRQARNSITSNVQAFAIATTKTTQSQKSLNQKDEIGALSFRALSRQPSAKGGPSALE
ncbi:Gamma-aminobutyric acid type B receptor subunit 1 [Chytriomyces hyalinus]|nr:Gamma-aminobutyric acid type B receptor subunit 1 [Chytriomyces hyalinus]